jgi:MoxR-like ATPase
MDRPFASISLTSGASESQLTGRLLPTGDGGKFEYHESPFVSMYESGGVFLLDELDAADPNMLLVINTALANGHFTVEARAPACDIIRHENTIIIGAANTYGTGADAQYVGRQQLDAATLDRWYVVEMTYDAALECDMAGLKKKSSSAWNAAPDPTADEIKEIGVWVRKLRDDINKAKLRRTASTRMLEKAIRARKAGISFAEIKADLLAGWSRDELAKVGVSA